MLLLEQQDRDMLVYGKTGLGKSQGVVVDAWFTGFADTTNGRRYFCVYFTRPPSGSLLLLPLLTRAAVWNIRKFCKICQAKYKFV